MSKISSENERVACMLFSKRCGKNV